MKFTSFLVITLLCIMPLSINAQISQLISTESSTISKGQASFTLSCSTCHNFKQNGVGPQLGGITNEVSVEWIRNFIKNPKKIIDSGDERARKQVDKFHGAIMPSFAYYSEDEINEIISFLHSQRETVQHVVETDLKEISNPISHSIELSDLMVELELMTQIPPSSDQLPRTRITKLDFQPAKKELFILDLRGKLYKLKKNKPKVYLDMEKVKPNFIHQPGLATGFGSFAFHPEFAKNGLLYTTHTEPPASGKADFNYADSIPVTLQWVLSEWKTEQPSSFPFSGKSRELFRINMVTGIHGVQEITFNALAKPGDEDFGLLYIGVGDGGCVEEGFSILTNKPKTVWGTILRIDPLGRNSLNGQYGIPQSNPFNQTRDTEASKEIYAYGFRNPHRITWSKSGQMLAVNIGQHNIEALNIIKPSHFYGWPIREGTFVINPFGDMTKVYPLPSNDSIYHVTYPVAQYDHDDGLAISGGFEYSGITLPSLAGKFLFGDIAKGRLFYVDMPALVPGKQSPIKEWQVSVNGVRKTLVELCGNDRADMRFGRDYRGELYLLTKTDGKVYRLVSSKSH